VMKPRQSNLLRACTSANRFLGLENENGEACLREDDSRGEAVRAGTHDHDVVAGLHEEGSFILDATRRAGKCQRGPKTFFWTGGRDSGGPITPSMEPALMNLVAAVQDSHSTDQLETLALSPRHLGFLSGLAERTNMAPEFGVAHLIRALIDRVEANGLDLSEASSEHEITGLVLASLEGEATRPLCRRAAVSATSSSDRSTARRSYRSNLPGRGRSRPGRPPRSGRG
jgi:hypothetical protein